MGIYYEDEWVTLYHGDCREETAWLDADALITDPPYGRGWKQGHSKGAGLRSDAHPGIEGDRDTTTRDAALSLWGKRIGIVFGDLMLAPPENCKQVLIYQKPPNAGTRGAMGGWRRDAEAIYLVGPWLTNLSARKSSVIQTGSPTQGNPHSPQGRFGHPHAKPLDIMEALIGAACAAYQFNGTPLVADPFSGSGSTLVAAKAMLVRSVGVETDERHCEMAARRLAQDNLFGAA